MSLVEWFGNIELLHSNSTLRLTPHGINVKLPSNGDPFVAEIKWYNSKTYDNTIEPNSIYCGDTLRIYIGTINPPSILVFEGRVYKIGSEYTGEAKSFPEKYIIAYGYGRDLLGVYRRQAIPSNFASTIVNILGTELKSMNIISDYNCKLLADRFIRKIDGNKTYDEILKQLCNDSDLIYYVDNDRVLRVFSKAKFIFDSTIIPDYKANPEWDISNIMNSIEIVGTASYQYGSFELNTINWSACQYTLDAYGNTIEVPATISLDTINMSTVVMSSGDSTLGVILDFTLPNTLDLSYGGNVRFNLYESSRWKNKDVNLLWGTGLHPSGKSNLVLAMMSGLYDYYYATLTISGGIWKQSWDNMKECSFSITDADISVGYNYYNFNAWNKVGSPNWSQISKIRWILKEPLSCNCNKIGIRNLRFTDQELHVGVGSSSSIAKYGLRCGKPLKDSNIEDTIVAVELGSILVESYKVPKLRITNIDFDPFKLFGKNLNSINPDWNGINFMLPLGWNSTISIFGYNYVSNISNIQIGFDSKKLQSNIDVSDAYVPSIDRVFKTMTSLLDKFGWDLESFRKITASYYLLDSPSELVGWDRLSSDFGLDYDAKYSEIPIFSSRSDTDILSQYSTIDINPSYIDLSVWNGFYITANSKCKYNIFRSHKLGMTFIANFMESPSYISEICIGFSNNTSADPEIPSGVVIGNFEGFRAHAPSSNSVVLSYVYSSYSSPMHFVAQVPLCTVPVGSTVYLRSYYTSISANLSSIDAEAVGYNTISMLCTLPLSNKLSGCLAGYGSLDVAIKQFKLYELIV